MRALTVLGVAVMVAVVFGALPGGGGEAAWPGDNGRILYDANGAEEGIWVMDADGSNREQLTTEGFDTLASWSHDASEIVFVRYVTPARAVGPAGTLPSVWRMDASGVNQTFLAMGNTPSFSPDGNRIIYAVDGDIHEMDAGTGDNDVAITDEPQFHDAYPAYRPDGSAIAFMREYTLTSLPTGVAGDLAVDIFTATPEGEDVTNLTETPQSYEVGLDWAPDGEALTFLLAGEIWVVSYPDGTTTMVFERTGNFQLNDPTYSPDGTRIAFSYGAAVPGRLGASAEPAGNYAYSIWTMHPDGDLPGPLEGSTLGIDEFDPDWAPATGPTPTPTTVPGQDVVWGDAQCDDEANPVDSLLTLRFDAGLSTDTGECPPLGDEVMVVGGLPARAGVGVGTVFTWGDVDCGGGVDPVDSLKLLRYDAGLEVDQEPPCPEIGETVTILEGV